MGPILGIISVTSAFIAAVVILFDWFDLISTFQLRRNIADRKDALNLIERHESDLFKRLNKHKIPGNFYLVGALHGLFKAQRLNASAYDAMHQTLRKSFGLEPYSLQETKGILDRQKVDYSFDEMEQAIIYQRENYEQRDLKMVAFWSLIVMLFTGVAAFLI